MARSISPKKDGFKVSFGPVLQHSLNPSVTLLNWVEVYNAVCTPTPIHRLCTQTFLHHRKQTHFRESNLRYLRLARVPVKMLTHYTNPPPQIISNIPHTHVITNTYKIICKFIVSSHSRWKLWTVFHCPQCAYCAIVSPRKYSIENRNIVPYT